MLAPPSPQPDRLQDYLDSLTHQRKLATLSIVSYRRDLRELRELADHLPGTPRLADLRHFHVRRFASQLHARGLSPRSIARKLSAWRGFFSWLAEHGLISANPVDGVKAPKRGKPLPKALSADDAVRLVAGTSQVNDADTARSACDTAMFELLYSCGLRVSELTQLDVHYVRSEGYESSGWIDLAGAEVTVTGKGSKKRTVPVGRFAVHAIRRWLVLRAGVAHADPHALFLTERGTRISPRVVQLRLQAHAQNAGIPAHVHPHMLRHSFASHVLQSSGDLRAVQEMLGHVSIASTQIYTALDFQRLAQVYDVTHPRAKKST